MNTNRVNELSPLDVPDAFGGVGLYLVVDDGEVLCERCAVDPTNPVHCGGEADGWRFEGWQTTEADEETVQCAHCGRIIWDADED